MESWKPREKFITGTDFINTTLQFFDRQFIRVNTFTAQTKLLAQTLW